MAAAEHHVHLPRTALVLPPLLSDEVGAVIKGLAAFLSMLVSCLGPQVPDRHALLRDRVMRLGDVREELVDDAVQAAIGVETERVPAELLLALAWWESRLEPGLRNGRVCGALQVKPEDVGERGHRDACHRWSQDTWQGFEAGAHELETWLDHAGGRMDLALRGRACGWSGLTRPCGKDWWVREVRRTSVHLSGK